MNTEVLHEHLKKKSLDYYKESIDSFNETKLKLDEILGNEGRAAIQNRSQRRQLTSFEKEKTKTQLVIQVKVLQSYVNELVNNPDSDFAKSIIEGVKRQ